MDIIKWEYKVLKNVNETELIELGKRGFEIADTFIYGDSYKINSGIILKRPCGKKTFDDDKYDLNEFHLDDLSSFKPKKPEPTKSKEELLREGLIVSK